MSEAGRKRARMIDALSIEETRRPKRHSIELRSTPGQMDQTPSSNLQFISSLEAKLPQPQQRLGNVEFLSSSFAYHSRQAGTQGLLGNTPLIPSIPSPDQHHQDGKQCQRFTQRPTAQVITREVSVSPRAEHAPSATLPHHNPEIESDALGTVWPQIKEDSSGALLHKEKPRLWNTSKYANDAVPLTIQQNMHFANVAFLRQLSRRQRQQAYGNDQEPLDPQLLAAELPRPALIQGDKACLSSEVKMDPANKERSLDYGSKSLDSMLNERVSLFYEDPFPSQPAPEFVYPHLINTKSSIRLLEINPGPISCTSDKFYGSLISVNLWDNRVKYDCLSYCWGGQSSVSRRILIRTTDQAYQFMPVTQNLYSALQDLRATSRSTLYWIDAICIDQTDSAERSDQVSLMKDIYGKASGVVISLGSSTPRLSAAVDTIRRISDRFEDDTHTSPQSIIGSLGLNLTAEDIEQLKSYTEFAYQEVALFFSLPWFRRVWVLQEAFSQTNISVRLGTHTLPWGSVIIAALWQAQFTRSHTAAFPGYNEAGGDGTRQFLPELWLSLLHTRNPRGLSMMELASRARDFQATDPRDRVFALLGLANDIGPLDTRPLGLTPDYTLGTFEVYANFARAIILKTRKLDVLSLVNTFDTRTERQSLVSWIPTLDASVATIRGLGFPTKYNAAFSTKVHEETTSQSTDSLHVLTLAGFRVDTVRGITKSVMRFSQDLQLYLGDNIDAVTELWRTHVKSRYSESSETHSLRQYLELITATGFALPTDFPAQPLGRVVPTRHVPSVRMDFAAYWARLDPDFMDFQAATRAELKAVAKLGDAEQFAVLAGKACHERKFLTTSDGRMGLCPRDTEAGDTIVILFGGSVPYVLRPTSNNQWRFIGECYIDGLMFGETQTFREGAVAFQIV